MTVLNIVEKEIGQGTLKIECYLQDMGWGIKEGMRVTFPDFMQEEKINSNRELYSKIMRYTANKFQQQQLTRGNELVARLAEENFEMLNELQTVITGEYAEGKSAIIYAYIGSKTGSNCIETMDISPAIRFEGVSPFGFTVVPGSMSDFTIHPRREGGLFGYTTDFMRLHFGLVSFFLMDVAKNIYDIIENNQVPEDFEKFSRYDYLYADTQLREDVSLIRQHLLQQVTVNQGKHIEKIQVDGKTLLDKLQEFHVSKYLVSNNFLLNMGILFGKRPSAVQKFIEKTL